MHASRMPGEWRGCLPPILKTIILFKTGVKEIFVLHKMWSLCSTVCICKHLFAMFIFMKIYPEVECGRTTALRTVGAQHLTINTAALANCM